MRDFDELEDRAQKLRQDVLAMAVHAGGAHVSPAYSIIDLLVVLYGRHLRVTSETVDDPDRDRFVLSKGHGSAALYALLAQEGFIEREQLKGFCSMGSKLGGHPDVNKVAGVEASTGSLGHGFAMAVGMALAAQLNNKDYRVATILGDGECQEGSIWESAMAAVQLGLDNLVVIVDANGLQGMGEVESINQLEPFTDKWKSFGWTVREIDGHDLKAIDAALSFAFTKDTGPFVIIARTIKGKGVSFMEGQAIWHYRLPNDEEMEQACSELGLDNIEAVLS